MRAKLTIDARDSAWQIGRTTNHIFINCNTWHQEVGAVQSHVYGKKITNYDTNYTCDISLLFAPQSWRRL